MLSCFKYTSLGVEWTKEEIEDQIKLTLEHVGFYLGVTIYQGSLCLISIVPSMKHHFHSRVGKGTDNTTHPYCFKPFGFWCLKTSYLLTFFICSDNDAAKYKILSATGWPALQLRYKEQFWYTGLFVFIKNWCSTITLMTIMLDRGVYLLGTVRSNT